MQPYGKTAKFLLCISSHIVGKRKYKDIEPIVIIHTDGTISMRPKIYIKHGNSRIPTELIQHVMKKHHYQGELRPYYLKESDHLIPGTYKYSYSITHKKRTWIRISE